MTCNCRSTGECWHFSPEEWEEMRLEAAKIAERQRQNLPHESDCTCSYCLYS